MTVTKGFDCATPLTLETAGAFKQNGYDFVARYLVPSSWKSLSASEAQQIIQAGLNIVSVFETTADRALTGRDGGLQDGQIAVQCAEAVGQLKGSAIYFAVDFYPTADQMQTIIDYIKAANEASPDYATGVYGAYDVCKAVIEAGAATRAWQTYAWSHGQKYSCQIYQYKNDITVNGIGIDEDESYGNEGWWGQPEPVVNVLSATDANYIIDRWLAHEYDLASDVDKNTRHDLANKLRKASGQPEE